MSIQKQRRQLRAYDRFTQAKDSDTEQRRERKQAEWIALSYVAHSADRSAISARLNKVV